ncbi:MAG: M24 family metallopeptidase [Planctomycetes bacterium]|nr:M24 family metallopeptidase [Planctomycetota bacterium]MCH9725749.1 M24 family metallopeptidase [Planctomycetota bacterium]MCH9777804.1 M24 family metallopeptidase [Planctomycetota bacterium]MCH9792853.1 M24 family metallopeptidase [Planctomycetota bacterium]
MKDFREYQAVQQAAKQTLSDIAGFISPSATEESIAAFAQERLAELGFPETWYHACPAFVLLGSRSCLSISGRDYIPATEPVGETNLITVDLSPCRSSIWGDCALSFVVEDGVVVVAPVGLEFQRGLKLEEKLHLQLRRFVTPDTTFSDLFEFANDLITSEGYENLDFLGNVGHSIAKDLSRREFAESGNDCSLGSVNCFTFEPHIREQGGRWGFKHENIYYFDEHGEAIEL